MQQKNKSNRKKDVPNLLKNKWRTHAEALCRVPRPPALRRCLLSRAGPNHQQNKSQIKREAWQAAKILTTTWREAGGRDRGGGRRGGAAEVQQLTSKTSTLTATATATTTTTSLQATSNYFLYFAATKAEGSKRHAGRRAAGKGERGRGCHKSGLCGCTVVHISLLLLSARRRA